MTLAIGWIMSCALVTAVTLTAVERVGHEVAGTQPSVLSRNNVEQAVAEQSSSAAAASSASASATKTASPTPTTSVPPTKTEPSRVKPPAHTSTPPPLNPTPTTPPPSVTSMTEPAPESSVLLSGSPPQSSSSSPPPSTGTSSSAPPAYKKTFTLTDASGAMVGSLTMVCSGSQPYTATASPNGDYTATVNQTETSVDVVFTLQSDKSTSEYVFACSPDGHPMPVPTAEHS